MIEIKKIRNDKFQLWIDGVRLGENEYHVRRPYRVPNKAKRLVLSIFTENPSRKVAGHCFSDLPAELVELTLHTRFPLLNPTDLHGGIEIQRRQSKGSEQFELYLNFAVKAAEWKHLWSSTEYIEEFSRIVESESDLKWVKVEPTITFIQQFSLQLPTVMDTSVTIEAAVNKYSNTLNQLQELTEASLMAKLRSDSVVVQFDFPEEVRVPCEQYLLYFAQFLRDLGVRADTALTHEAGQVLFTVTPADKEQALDKIRAALNAYLHLPSNPVSDAANESIAVQRLEANLLRLKSDLKLAAAELQAKNTTIEAQQLMLNVQKGLLSGEIVVNAMKNVTPEPKDKDREELLDGTVSIIPIKGKGVEINLPELLRRLKRLFKEEG